MSATYRANVTDKQQGDIEAFNDHSATRFAWFDGKALQTGVMKAIPAYDTSAQGNAGEAKSDVVRTATNILGSHNDRPFRFETPGKA